ncbi:hypothetical protein GOY13_00120 [Wolbachia endosymbiont of Cruorifilaria tuberocauda]|uniref:hypothetical protein n=1 Tax=Wolbachia endosymbiont of Cruorifilaria tuberocauda TaxID=1812111 RepID=UPI00158E63F2|nr:hypothetical protein [Wolbachia endosymbiont of Cruorifilaria tuberocauda]QKX01390.1 hypothetical protein GOY13_00120 [Wolbachia endosymbiont of Cruorifilaria tuberocauda]
MRKVFTHVIVSLLLFIPATYSGFWYFSTFKIKNLLAEIMLYISSKKPDVSSDFSGFPSSLIFHIINPKFSNEELTISSDSLLIRNRLFDKSIYIYVPSNEVSIIMHGNKKGNIKCHTNNNNHFIVKLSNSPSLLWFNKNINIIDYIDKLRYEDYGLKCDASLDLENQQSITTEVNGKSNYIQLHINKEPSKNNKLKFDFYIHRYKDSTNPESYLSIDTKFDYEFINQISATRINFNIEKFLIQNNNFSITADGMLNNYNMVTSSFKNAINVSILNYRELISFITRNPKTSGRLEKLISSLSERTTDNSIHFSIKYNENTGSSSIGKLHITDLIDQLDKISELDKNENDS